MPHFCAHVCTAEGHFQMFAPKKKIRALTVFVYCYAYKRLVQLSMYI